MLAFLLLLMQIDCTTGTQQKHHMHWRYQPHALVRHVAELSLAIVLHMQ